MARRLQYIFAMLVLMMASAATAWAGDGKSKFAKLNGAHVHSRATFGTSAASRLTLSFTSGKVWAIS